MNSGSREHLYMTTQSELFSKCGSSLNNETHAGGNTEHGLGMEPVSVYSGRTGNVSETDTNTDTDKRLCVL